MSYKKISIFNSILTAKVIQLKFENPIKQSIGLINGFHFVSEFLYTKQYTDISMFRGGCQVVATLLVISHT